MPLINSRRPKGVALISAKAQKAPFAHKFHPSLLPQHQTAVWIHQHHLCTARKASVSFRTSLYPVWSAAYPLMCLIIPDDHIYLQVLKYSSTLMLSLGILKGISGDRTMAITEKQIRQGGLPMVRARACRTPIHSNETDHTWSFCPVFLGKREATQHLTELEGSGLYISILQLKPVRR